MNLQQERIDDLCAQIGFKGLPNHYITLCQVAAKEEWTYSDFLENALRKEAEDKEDDARSKEAERRQRAR